MRVFISYKWETEHHNRWVERLARDLRARGIDALLDKWEVRLGESFSEYMTRAVTSADAVLFVMTPVAIEAAEAASPKGGAVKFEVQLATARKIAGEHFRFIGILRKGNRPAGQLRDKRYIDFRRSEKYSQTLEVLIRDLLGETGRPPLVPRAPDTEEFRECGQVGSELKSPQLGAEFIGDSEDMAVWEESAEGPTSPFVRYRKDKRGYKPEPVTAVDYATRVRSNSLGDLVVTQERKGVSVLTGDKLKSFLSIETVGEPIIRSEAVHATKPIVAVGTDYGSILCWDYSHDRVLFERRYFPREQIQWISGLAIDHTSDEIIFCIDNVLHRVRVQDGELITQHRLGPPLETGAIAFDPQRRYVVIGTTVNARVHELTEDMRLLYEVRIGSPLPTMLRFNADGSLLGVVYGGIGAGGASVVESVSGRVVAKFTEVSFGGEHSPSQLFRVRIRWLSFARTGLLAVGEGSRVGLYRRITGKKQGRSGSMVA